MKLCRYRFLRLKKTVGRVFNMNIERRSPARKERAAKPCYMMRPWRPLNLNALLNACTHARRRWRSLCPSESAMAKRRHGKASSHVFDLTGHPKATRAYAWSSPIEGSDKRRFFAVLHEGPVKSPVDEVRASIVAENRK